MKDRIWKFLNGQKMSCFIRGGGMGFMFCIFAPLDIFFTNRDEFWFSLSQLLPMLIMTFVAFVVIFTIIVFLTQVSKAALYIYGFLLWAYIYFYIQGNYIPRNYGVLNGAEIDWSNYKSYAIASIVLIIVCAMLCIISLMKLKTKLYHFGRYICIFILLIQIITISVVWVQDKATAVDRVPEQFVVTNEDLLSLSAGNNIIIFLLDTFDSRDMLNLVEGDDAEEYQELFKGFTYYPNTLGAYPTTKGALPHILTGELYYNNKPYSEYVLDAYINNPLYEALKENNFSIGVYTEATFLNRESYMYTNVDTGTYYINDYRLFWCRVYKLVAFNYLPHQLKKYINVNIDGYFESLRSTLSGGGAYSDDVQKNYAYLTENGISVAERGNCFRFYHTLGIHEGYTFGKDLITEPGISYSVYDEAEGNCTYLRTYFDQMKENGIYDSSTIIVMADHGHYDYSQNPLFMIKNAGDAEGFKVSEEEMSYMYLRNIFVSLVNGERVTEEYIRDCGKGQERLYLYYTWDDSWGRNYLPKLQEMRLDGFAGDADNLQNTGKEYLGQDE